MNESQPHYVKTFGTYRSISEISLYEALLRAAERGYSRDEECIDIANYYMRKLCTDTERAGNDRR